MYTIVSVSIDRRVKIVAQGDFDIRGETTFGPDDKRHILRWSTNFAHPYPIFKEMPYQLVPFYFTISDRLLGQNLTLGYHIQAPGCFKQNHGFLEIGPSRQMHPTFRAECRHLHMPPN